MTVPVSAWADPDLWFQTALHYAASRLQGRAVELLLAAGAAADAVDGMGRTPLSIALGLVCLSLSRGLDQ
jgi:ankyrin repeat protein